MKSKYCKLSAILLAVVMLILSLLTSCANNYSTDASTDNSTVSQGESSKNTSSNVVSKAVTECKNVKLVSTEKVDKLVSEGTFSFRSFYDKVSGKSMPYRLHIPEKIEPGKKYPVILFLHGAGEIGNNNKTHLPHFSQSFTVAGDILEESVIVCPQTPSGWGSDKNGYLSIAKRILDYAIETYSGDEDRIYLTGLSLGSFATWSLLELYPNTFAAVVPVCGGAGNYATPQMIQTPIWMFHGTADSTVSYESSRSTYEAIITAGGTKAKLTPLEGVGHSAWDYAYTSREMFSWMFAQNRKNTEAVDVGEIAMFSIKNQSDIALLTNRDVLGCSYIRSLEVDYIELKLDSNAVERINKAYNDNQGEIFSFEMYQNHIYDFVLTKPIENERLVILQTVDDDIFNMLLKQLLKQTM